MSSTAPAPATAPPGQHGAAPSKRIRVNFMNIRSSSAHCALCTVWYETMEELAAQNPPPQ
ncbi:hypothetical protein GGF32_008835 [Allomyces javanicus]|nr:hypothetical protein GGF32_008835 [Allomyces javanicus]